MKILIIRFSSFGDVLLTTPVIRKIKEKFEHKIGFDWLIARSGKSIVIEEITATVDLSELTKDSYTERYSFDMYINTLEENIAGIEYIEKVEIDIKAK